MAVVLITGSLLVVYLSQLTGAEELFHECHHDKTEDFETECPCDQVIYIRSAAILFVCPSTEETCKPMKSITGHSSAVKCNGSSTCLVTKDIVNQFCSHGGYIEVVYDCVNSVPVPGPRVFHWCGTAEVTANQAFTINRCPCDQVIRIYSAEVGFSDQCAGQNVECTKMITDNPNIAQCNGNRSCSFNYLPPDKLCDEHQNGNFVKITYDCINVFRFHACRDKHVKHFTLDTCQLTGQVINIHSAEIGFSSEWSANDDPPKCLPKTTCRRLTERDEVWRFCDGKRNCSFSQNILNYTLCPNSENENFISISYNCINDRNAAVMITTTTHSADSGITLTEDPNAAVMVTTTARSANSGITLTEGAVAGIVACFVLLLVLLVIFIIIVIWLCRRSASSKVNDAGNSQVENAPNTYEMSSGDNSVHVYTEVNDQTEASAPATSTQPSASPPRSSFNDITLIDNDLYQ